MKLSLLKSSGVALLVAGLFSGQAFAAAAMANTKHDLSSGSTGGNQFSTATEICVFCHTPHGSNTAAPAPLWNRSMSTAAYNEYADLGTSTLDGFNAAISGTSKACLSCHDGTIAIKAVWNAPGSGAAADTAFALGTWTGSLAATGMMSGPTNLGSDMQNDHPVGIQYGGGPKSATAGYIPTTGGAGAYAANMMKDPGFVAAAADAGSWWVDTAAPGVREKTDLILFTRNETGDASYDGNEPYVECATCHDPHNTTPLFLRVANTGSALCVACHVK